MRLGTKHVVVCGLFTDQCVSSTVRDLSDWSCTVFLVEDATSAINADLQVWETRTLNQVYCKAVSTEEVLQNLAAQYEAASAASGGTARQPTRSCCTSHGGACGTTEIPKWLVWVERIS